MRPTLIALPASALIAASLLTAPTALAAASADVRASATGQATFGYTGGPQDWPVPRGVQSVYVTLVGAAGGAVLAQNDQGTTVPTPGGSAAQVSGTLALAPGTGAVDVWVGGAGGSLSNTGTPGTGGFNGGAGGGTGSWSPGASLPGAGGGGATDLRIGGYLPDTRVMVAGGGGGAGGAHQNDSGQNYQSGGVGGSGGSGTASSGVFPAQAGGDAEGDNAGAGGAGGVDSNGQGQLGGSAGTGTGNAGGGGGAGGWFGGAGGQAGQSGTFGYAAAAGGGGGGSSYVSPTQVTNASAVLAAAGTAPSATFQWVEISTTTLGTMTEGTAVSQQLSAVFPGPPGILAWQVTGGSLPSGLTLNSNGLLSGTPSRAQLSSFTVSASASTGVSPQPLATTTITFSGDVKSSVVPGVPTSVTAVGGVNSATVSWVAPTFTGGSPLVNYEVHWSTDSGATWSTPVTVPSTQTSYTASLAGGVSYIFQVAASNQLTTGLWSASSNAVLVTAPSSAPSSVSGTPAYESVDLTWAAPSQTGGASVTGYLIRYSTDGGGAWATMPNTGSSATSATVSNLTSQSGYIFEVAAVNSAGLSPWSAPSPVIYPILDPDAPSDVVATPAFQSVELAWQAPPNSTVPVTGYEIRYSSDSGTTWSDPVSTGSTETDYVMTGLTLPVPLIFEVAAAGPNGLGPWSAPSDAVTPETRPSPPTKLRGVPGDRTVTLTWDPPKDLADGTLSGYQVQWRTEDSATWRVHTYSTGTGATRYAVTGLSNGTGYRFRVAAITQYGVGLFSHETPTLTPFTVPGAPSGMTASPGDATATLTWQAPTADNGRVITGYRVQASADSGWYDVIANTGSALTTYTVTGLDNGTAYLFRVAAVNAAGAGAESTASAPVIPASVPAAPTQVAVAGSATSVRVTWSAPVATGGLPVTGYRVRWSGNGGERWTSEPTGGPATGFVIDDLRNGRPYLVQVAAVSAAGRSAWSATAGPVTPLARPGAPRDLRAQGEPIGKVVLTWRPPRYSGGAAVTAYRIAVSREGGAWAIQVVDRTGATATTLRRLDPYASYRFRIQAFTEAGWGPWSDPTKALYPR